MAGGKKKKKPFIDRHHAVKFHVLHRSQRDPLQADESAPQRVLVPAHKADDEKRSTTLACTSSKESVPECASEDKLVEHMKYGVYFDDGYDYMQHLRDVNETTHWEPDGPTNPVGRHAQAASEQSADTSSSSTNIQLPSSVFASSSEWQTGLLNRAAPHSGPRLDWDPDIVAALDEDFDYSNEDNILEDDFMTRANQPGDGSNTDSDDDWESCSDDDDDVSSSFFDKYAGHISGDDSCAADDDSKTYFTEYSMTSSVLPRNNNLTLLDRQFEKMYSDYADECLGAVEDGSDVDEAVNAFSGGETQAERQLMNKLLQSYGREEESGKLSAQTRDACDDDVSPAVRRHSVDDDDDLVYVTERVKDPSNTWDCQSILSTYSNLYNHPKLIEAPRKIRVNARGVPVVDGIESSSRSKGLTAAGLSALDKQQQQGGEGSSVGAAVSKVREGETGEQRKARKKVVREQRKERRAEKKVNKVAFRQEDKQQQKELVNARRNVQGVKLSAVTS